MCRCMGSHLHDWIDYDGVAFSIELLEWSHIFGFFRVRQQSSIFTVSIRTGMFVLQMKSKLIFIQSKKMGK